MRILLDMDEVLVDFVGGVCRLFDVPRSLVMGHWDAGEWSVIDPLTKATQEYHCEGGIVVPNWTLPDGFWPRISAAGEEFWLGLEPCPWVYDLLHAVESITEDWHVVSAPSRCPTSYTGKVKWLKRFFGPEFDRFCLTPHKHLFAGPDVLLIDDRESNVDEFRKAGGQAELFPAYHNSLYSYRDDPIKWITQVLQERSDAPQVP